MILGVNGELSSFGNNNELINSLTVLKVLVQVILEMLDGIHMLLDEIVSSYLFVWESSVVKLPSMDTGFTSHWVFSLLFHLGHDVHGVFVMMFIERS